MANGANRLFEVIKNTSEETQPTGAQFVLLTVKSLNPLIFNIDDRLDITKEFCIFDINFNYSNISVGDVVQALLLNNGQLYYILSNISFISLDNIYQRKVLHGTTTPPNNLGVNGDIYLQHG